MAINSTNVGSQPIVIVAIPGEFVEATTASLGNSEATIPAFPTEEMTQVNTVAQDLLGSLQNATMNAFETAKNALGQLPTQVSGFVASLETGASQLSANIATAFGNMKEGAVNSLTTAGQKLEEASGAVTSSLSNLASQTTVLAGDAATQAWNTAQHFTYDGAKGASTEAFNFLSQTKLGEGVASLGETLKTKGFTFESATKVSQVSQENFLPFAIASLAAAGAYKGLKGGIDDLSAGDKLSGLTKMTAGFLSAALVVLQAYGFAKANFSNAA